MKEKIKEIRIIDGAALKLNGKLDVREFHLTSEDIEFQLSEMVYEGENLILDQEVENSKLPPMIFDFYNFVFENSRIPSQKELIDLYSENFIIENDTWIFNENPYNKFGVHGRLLRSYPSLVRDIHFLRLCHESGYFDKARFSLIDDFYKGIDLRLKYSEFDFELSLHLSSKRGNFFKKVKYKRHNYNKKREIVLTLNRNDMVSVSNFHLYSPASVEKLLEIIQHRIEKEHKVKNLKRIVKNSNENIPFREPRQPRFSYIDLFAGIGGFHIAMNNLRGECVFSSEWDYPASQTYSYNFGQIPFGDITKESVKLAIPENFDLLCAGFPCQAFSIAGKRGGFEDTRGTLFFDVAEIIKRRRPKAIFLENVKGLRNHDKGRTLSTILNVLRNDLGYYVPEPKIMNAQDFGVPQNRERIFIVGFREDINVEDFEYPKPFKKKTNISDIIEENEVSVKYYLSTQYLETLRRHRARHESKGNGFGYEIIHNEGIANAIVVGGMGKERNLLIDNRLTNFEPVTKIKGEVNREGIRKMTPREWARLQGFPDKFKIEVSDAQAYKQFGNSVAVPAIQATAEKIIDHLRNNR